MTSERSFCRPSAMMPGIDLLCRLNPLTAYQFDAAVTTFGMIIKNALHETVEVASGNGKRSVAKYKIDELLNDNFQFRRPDPLAIFKKLGAEIYDEVS